MHLQDRRQPGKKNFTQARLASHKAADKTRYLAAAAKARESQACGQILRKGLERVDGFGASSVAEVVRITVREHDDVAGRQFQTPAIRQLRVSLPFNQQVINDQMAR